MEKIRRTMRREDGFTLVELLAVIVILGIILAIAIPAIGNVIDNSRTKTEAAEYDLIINAGRIYLTANPESEVKMWTGDVVTGTADFKNAIRVTRLVSEGYLELRGGRDGSDSYKDVFIVSQDNKYILAKGKAGTPIPRPGALD